MGLQELKAWVYRLNHKPYLYVRFFDSEMQGLAHWCLRDNGKKFFEWKGKVDVPVQENKKYAWRDNDGARNIAWVVAGPAASFQALPFAWETLMVEAERDRDLARERGHTIDLEEFYIMRHNEDAKSWYGSGKASQYFTIIIGLVIGIVAVGIAGSYLSSQIHFVDECFKQVGSNLTQFVCPAANHSVVNASSSASSAVTNSTSTASRSLRAG